MKFSFVMLTWNRPRFLDAGLAGLLAAIAHRGDCEILILDNGSTRETKDVLGRYADEQSLRVITLEHNEGLQAYRRLFRAARGTYIVVVDDDVLEFPPRVDEVFDRYMTAYRDYGFLCLNVVQNDYTNGAKPGPDAYVLDARNGLAVERGPAGGWCACFRRRHYVMLAWLIHRQALSMRNGEDGRISSVFATYLRKKSGVIRDEVCLHASGPYYAARYGHLDREIEKYAAADLDDHAAAYEKYRGESDDPHTDRAPGGAAEPPMT